VAPAAAPTASAMSVSATGCDSSSTTSLAIDPVTSFIGGLTPAPLQTAAGDPPRAGAPEAPGASAPGARLARLNLSGTVGAGGTAVQLTGSISSIAATTGGIGAVDTTTYTAAAVAQGAPTQSSSLAFGSAAIGLPGGGAADWAAGASVATINQLL